MTCAGHSECYVNATGAEDGLTALAAASKAGHADVVSLLLKDKRIQTNVTNSSGETALQLAQEAGHTDIVDLFLEADGCAMMDAWMGAQAKRAEGLLNGGGGDASEPITVTNSDGNILSFAAEQQPQVPTQA